jgi:hypothetical protein
VKCFKLNISSEIQQQQKDGRQWSTQKTAHVSYPGDHSNNGFKVTQDFSYLQRYCINSI